MRTNGLCRSVHEGSPGDKHSTRVKVESGGNLANPTGCEEGVATVRGLARAWACGRGDSIQLESPLPQAQARASPRTVATPSSHPVGFARFPPDSTFTRVECLSPGEPSCTLLHNPFV